MDETMKATLWVQRFRVEALGFKVQSLGQGLGFGVWGLGFRHDRNGHPCLSF